MKINNPRGVRRLTATAAALSAAALLAAGCSSSGGGNQGGTGAKSGNSGNSQAALDAALTKGGNLTFWTWGGSAPAQVKAFEKQYPNVHVNLQNVGTGNDQYTKLQNAIKAGNGAPDVVQIEYQALPQFGLPGYLVDLSKYGLGSLQKDFTSGDWEQALVNGKLYSLPQGGGPMVLFYNKRLFDKYHLTVPTSWDEYVADAKKLKRADPSACITNNDPGDAGVPTALIWQAGGRPFQASGQDVKINFQDPGTAKFTAVWNELMQDHDMCSVGNWTPDWNTALGNGTIATMPWGGWMAGVFQGLKQGAGDWRVAPMPTYDGGAPVSAEHGGSDTAVTKQSSNPALAAAFVRWLSDGAGSTLYAKLGGFPPTLRDLKDPVYLNHKWSYFGGQQVNKLIVAAANEISPGWEWLPYQVYANTIFADTVGQSYKSMNIDPGLQSWQSALMKYGSDQGFKVSTG